MRPSQAGTLFWMYHSCRRTEGSGRGTWQARLQVERTQWSARYLRGLAPHTAPQWSACPGLSQSQSDEGASPQQQDFCLHLLLAPFVMVCAVFGLFSVSVNSLASHLCTCMQCFHAAAAVWEAYCHIGYDSLANAQPNGHYKHETTDPVARCASILLNFSIDYITAKCCSSTSRARHGGTS